jgi:hypothetical protein
MNQTSAYGLLVYLGKHNSRTVKNRVRIPNRPPMKDIWEDLFYHLENYTEIFSVPKTTRTLGKELHHISRRKE